MSERDCCKSIGASPTGVAPNRAAVFASPAPVDLRKATPAYGLVDGLKRDPMNGDLFLFVNESRDLTTLGIRFAMHRSPLSCPDVIAQKRREIDRLRGNGATFS